MAVVLTCAVAVMLPGVSSTRYIVGANMGWTSNVNYTAWARAKHFHRGDWLYGRGVQSSVAAASRKPPMPCDLRALERTRGSRSPFGGSSHSPDLLISARLKRKRELPRKFVGERHGDSCGHRRRMNWLRWRKDLTATKWREAIPKGGSRSHRVTGSVTSSRVRGHLKGSSSEWHHHSGNSTTVRVFSGGCVSQHSPVPVIRTTAAPLEMVMNDLSDAKVCPAARRTALLPGQLCLSGLMRIFLVDTIDAAFNLFVSVPRQLRYNFAVFMSDEASAPSTSVALSSI
nr:lamin-like protein [Ipomoea batatas]